LSKDEALRQAKLSYLRQARGRSASPQYWAGLVLMGNTDPIAISKSYWWRWVLGGGVLAGIGWWFWRRRRVSG
ncbi:MAG: CHAT domain-containing protein, partial [Chitinophagaceae bacterium]